nr:hypothetical protein [uncultured Sphingomonas sp.]
MDYRRIMIATGVAGTLDIASAIILTMMADRSVGAMLAGIAAGPFGEGMRSMDRFGALAGLATHYGLMAIMVLVLALAIRRMPRVAKRPILVGTGYGLLIYLVMYWVVIPLRWPATPMPSTVRGYALPIIIHVCLVGLPVAMILCRRAASPRTSHDIDAVPSVSPQT